MDAHQCSYCSLRFVSWDQLQLHLDAEHPEPATDCSNDNQEGKSFNYSLYFFRHRARHLRGLRKRSAEFATNLNRALAKKRESTGGRWISSGKDGAKICDVCQIDICDRCPYFLSQVDANLIANPGQKQSQGNLTIVQPKGNAVTEFLRAAASKERVLVKQSSPLTLCETCNATLRRHEMSADLAQQLMHMQRPSARDAPQILVLYSRMRALMDVASHLVDESKKKRSSSHADLKAQDKSTRRQFAGLRNEIAEVSDAIARLGQDHIQLNQKRSENLLCSNIRLSANYFIENLITRYSATTRPPMKITRIVSEQKASQNSRPEETLPSLTVKRPSLPKQVVQAVSHALCLSQHR
ncbi:hypothetical protein AAVH_01348 [Aphelenchoides avenae]|nr:hypothetical protein AAVH_01348 [Aphelenchus avenae]